MAKKKYLKFRQNIEEFNNAPTWSVVNSSDVVIGLVRRERNGAYLHWNFVVTREMFEDYPEVDYYNYSMGCWDEIREFCRNPFKYIRNQALKENE